MSNFELVELDCLDVEAYQVKEVLKVRAPADRAHGRRPLPGEPQLPALHTPQ